MGKIVKKSKNLKIRKGIFGIHKGKKNQNYSKRGAWKICFTGKKVNMGKKPIILFPLHV